MRATVAAAVLVFALALARPAAAQPVLLDIPRAATPPTLDNYLPPDLTPTPISDFRQRQPGDGDPATQPTTVYVSYDNDHLYVVFVCRDADPRALRARLARREDINSDDRVTVAIDSFHDQRRAYLFTANPLGIQAEGIMTEGIGDDLSFDTLWRSEGRLTADGYVVLMAIPFKSLRFPRVDALTWGMAFGREIPRNNEQSWWPPITARVEGFTQQFATARGIQGVSPGRNLQLIPYGAFAGGRFFDRTRATFATASDWRGGLDAKVVVRDAITIDAALNPDFSQVESDSPQVTINQRFEVFFPEKRPFFIENADLFQTPGELLFFSRRVADPQFGARVTGTLGRWSFGGLTIDDRAAGRRLAADDPARDDRAAIAVARAQADLGNQSNVAFMVTSRDFAGGSNRVAAVDLRYKLNANWVVTGQAVATETQTRQGTRLSGPGYNAALLRMGRGLFYRLAYAERSPDFRADLGFVPRTDTREVVSFLVQRWRPKSGALVSFGPNLFVYGNWNHRGELDDWRVNLPFQFEWKGETSLFIRRSEGFQRFAGFEFRDHQNAINFGTSVWKALSLFTSVSTAKQPNFFPGPGLSPFLAEAFDASLSIVARPQPPLRLEGLYIYGRLASGPDRIFDNHIVRGRIDYQLSREWSIRGIVDYNAVLSNATLVALEREKRLTADFLMTYLLNPGTALYVGYTDGLDNLTVQPGDPTTVRRRGGPALSTGRQFFIKTSYLWRF